MQDSNGVTVTLQILDVPDIPYITNISTPLVSDKTYPPTYGHLPRPVPIQYKTDKKWSLQEIFDGTSLNDKCTCSIIEKQVIAHISILV